MGLSLNPTSLNSRIMGARDAIRRMPNFIMMDFIEENNVAVQLINQINNSTGKSKNHNVPSTGVATQQPTSTSTCLFQGYVCTSAANSRSILPLAVLAHTYLIGATFQYFLGALCTW